LEANSLGRGKRRIKRRRRRRRRRRRISKALKTRKRQKPVKAAPDRLAPFGASVGSGPGTLVSIPKSNDYVFFIYFWQRYRLSVIKRQKEVLAQDVNVKKRIGSRGRLESEA